MICKAGDLTKEDIGAIRIAPTESFVEIRQSSLAGFLKALDGTREIEAGVILHQLDKVPDLASGPRGPSGPRPTTASKRRKPLEDRGDHPSEAPRQHKPAPQSPRPKRAPRPEDTRPEGVVEPLKKKKKAPTKGKADHKLKGGGKAPKAGKPGKPGLAPKVGKPSSKKNKARRAAALQSKANQGGQGAPRRKGPPPQG